MTINSFLGTLFGYMATSEKYTMDDIVLFLILLAFVGVSLSRIWYLLVTNFTTVNSAKWNVIYDMEKKLPYQPFQSEWEGNLKYIESSDIPNFVSWLCLPRKKAYYSTSRIDSQLPRLFGLIYITLGLGAIAAWVYKSEWLHSKVSDIVQFLVSHIVQFLKNVRDFGLGWVVVVILIVVLAIVVLVAIPFNRRKKSAKDSSAS